LPKLNDDVLVQSPSLDCTTNLSFYTALVIELKFLCGKLDKCPALCRKIIWEQLFIIVGVEKAFDGLMTPVLEETLNGEGGVVVLDLEILFIAMLLVVRLCPEILELREDSGFLNHKERENILIQNARDFFYSLRKYHSGGTDIPSMRESPVFPQCWSENLSLLTSKYPICGNLLLKEPFSHYTYSKYLISESPDVEETSPSPDIISRVSSPNIINVTPKRIGKTESSPMTSLSSSPSTDISTTPSQTSILRPNHRKSAFYQLKREYPQFSASDICSSKKQCLQNKS